MSRPKHHLVFEGRGNTGTSRAISTLGHPFVALTVAAHNFDPANDTLDLRVETRIGDAWVPVDGFSVAAGDLSDSEGTGVQSAYVFPGIRPMHEIRVNMTSISTGSIDCSLLLTGWPEAGLGYNAE